MPSGKGLQRSKPLLGLAEINPKLTHATHCSSDDSSHWGGRRRARGLSSIRGKGGLGGRAAGGSRKGHGGQLYVQAGVRVGSTGLGAGGARMQHELHYRWQAGEGNCGGGPRVVPMLWPHLGLCTSGEPGLGGTRGGLGGLGGGLGGLGGHLGSRFLAGGC